MRHVGSMDVLREENERLKQRVDMVEQERAYRENPTEEKGSKHKGWREEGSQ